VTKCYHPRLIDLPPPKNVRSASIPNALSVQEEDGSPDVANVQRLRFPNGALTDHGGGDISVAGGSGEGTPHQAWLAIPLPADTIPPGPLNQSGADRTISKVNILSDGEVAGSVIGYGAFSISAGGGVLATSTPVTWADATRLSVTGLTLGTDATYLIIDWLVS
jgi:hypothetical protein